MAIALRYAARSDVGLVRQSNQDSGYAGPHLLVVADGMGGHAGGDVASSLAVGLLAPLDEESHGSGVAAEQLKQAVAAAHQELMDRVRAEPQLSGMGTTITALLRSGNRLALAHLGDSRAYWLHDGVLQQLTKDHTFVQTLVDHGRITAEEAEHHPQRSVLMKVLSDVVEDVDPDLSVREAHVGDRYLICSDGLSGVVSFDTLQETLAKGEDPAATCEQLVSLALRAGAPDNVTCVVADVVEADQLGDSAPYVVGAAASERPSGAVRVNGSAAERAAALAGAGVEAPREPDPDAPVPPGRGRRIALRAALAAAVVAVLAAASAAGLAWVNSQYFVGTDAGTLAIYQGVPQGLGPLSLSSVREVVPDVRVADLPQYQQDRVRDGIVADSRSQARQIVRSLREQVCPSPSASPSAATPGSATPAASPAATGAPRPVTPAPAGATVRAATVTPSPGPTAAPAGTPGTATGTAAASPSATGAAVPDCPGANR